MTTFLAGRGPLLRRKASVLYAANPVHFDGSAWLNIATNLTGAADAPEGTISFWIRPTLTLTTQRIMAWNATADPGVTLTTTNAVAFQLPDSGLDLRTSALVIGDWHHVALSWIRNSFVQLYRNTVSDLAINNAFTAGTTDFTTGAFAIGAGTSSGGNKYQGDMADLQAWLGTGKSVDLASGALALFISGGAPVNPSVAAATLGTPIVGMTGPTSTWQNNLSGSGGVLTETGALADGTGPVEL